MSSLTVDVRAQSNTRFDQRPRSCNVMLLGPARRFSAAADGWTFANPLPVRLEREDDGSMLAVDELFGNYGQGDSWDATVADLTNVLTGYYRLLEASDDPETHEVFEDLKTYLRHVG